MRARIPIAHGRTGCSLKGLSTDEPTAAFTLGAVNKTAPDGTWTSGPGSTPSQ